MSYKGRKMFALFDFDEAFNDWDGLKHSEMIEEDPSRGLGKRLLHKSHCAFLLPITSTPFWNLMPSMTFGN